MTATYSVECIYCEALILTTLRIGDAEASTVVAHLRERHPAVLDEGRDLGFADVFKHVRIRMV